MRSCGSAFALVIMLSAVAAAGTPAQVDVTATLAAGDAALAALDLTAATTAYRSAHGAAPTSYEAAWKLARALTDGATLASDPDQEKRLCVEAEELARLAVRLAPADSKGHAYLAVAVGKLALHEGGKRKVELSKEVKTEAEEALRLKPDEDVALHVLAIWNREMVELGWLLKKVAELLYGRFPSASLEAAITSLRRAVLLAPDVIPHHVELGITLASAQRWPEAEAELEKGLALPTGWVTDDHYRALAKTNLAKVRQHLR
jgi:tetratricopeptide (TPR) repeat protein